MLRSATLLASLVLSPLARSFDLWKSPEPLANVHLSASFEAEEDDTIEVSLAPDATARFEVKAGQAGTLAVGARQKQGERGEIGAWLNGKPLGEIRRYGSAGNAKAKGSKGAQFIASDEEAGQFPTGGDFTAYAKFRTRGDGSLFSKAKPGGKWLADGKVLYLRGGRLVYDIGWHGALRGGPKVNDGKWHEVALVTEGKKAAVYLDGKPIAENKDFSAEDPAGTRFQIGACARDFGGDFDGEIANVRFWKRALDTKEVTLAVSGKIDETNTPDFNWTPEGSKAAASNETKVIDGYLAHPVTIRASSGDASVYNVKVSQLAEADHERIIRSWDHNSLERGARIYNGLCITCHGNQEIEGSLPTALRFHSGDFKNGADLMGMYQTLTKGYELMMPQPWMTPQQKWDVIHYIRNTFLEPTKHHQFIAVDDEQLAELPRGLGLGPEKPQLFGEDDPKWKKMDYGPVQFWTIQVAPGNIAYKGIAVRLDEGPGGVAAGNKWMLYDHDLMRVAAAWEGEGYIDWRGIAFDQSHGSHASLVGEKAFENPVGPGVASPDGSFDDPRFLGRDGKPYGPLPRDWTQYKGLYMHGNRPVLKYSIGNSLLLETPGYEMLGDTTVFTRSFTVLKSDAAPLLRIAPEGAVVETVNALTRVVDGFICASPINYGARSFKVYIAKAGTDPAALKAYVAKAGSLTSSSLPASCAAAQSASKPPAAGASSCSLLHNPRNEPSSSLTMSTSNSAIAAASRSSSPTSRRNQ